MEQKYCGGCETTKDISEFRKRTAAKDGLQSQCSVCMDDRSKVWAKENHQKKMKKQRERQQRLMFRWREWKTSQGCKCCDETEGCCLELHHTDPSNKEHNVSEMIVRCYGWDKIMEEAAKGIVVCSNCHKKLHHGIIQI